MAITNPAKPRALWLKRLLWLISIWTASVLAMLAAAYLMRLFMHAIGLHS
ncbi:DUF2474 domain-containing protein [Methylobacillus gramineus]|nr:DUF2474 domain-containing protein [Methylobacillus gramineus]MCB5183918.1 DUF2474 domain-containing protein [Methylobacillus gramineus]